MSRLRIREVLWGCCSLDTGNGVAVAAAAAAVVAAAAVAGGTLAVGGIVAAAVVGTVAADGPQRRSHASWTRTRPCVASRETTGTTQPPWRHRGRLHPCRCAAISAARSSTGWTAVEAAWQWSRPPTVSLSMTLSLLLPMTARVLTWSSWAYQSTVGHSEQTLRRRYKGRYQKKKPFLACFFLVSFIYFY